MIGQVTTKNGEKQKFSYYEIKKTGKHVVRFYVDNYFGDNGKKKRQWNGKGCTFKTIGEAAEFGTFVCQNIPKANCQIAIKKFLDEYADKKSSTLEQYLCT